MRARLESVSCWRAQLTAVCAVLWLTACAGTPPVPEWKLRSSAALDRATQATLSGEMRRARGDYQEAFDQIARSGQPALMARAHLLKCAVEAASLDFTGCAEFDARRMDASPGDQAYADYLVGILKPADLAKLPAALTSEGDPLTRLVAASVLLRTGQASPEVIAVAVETASAQGWRYPLAAWLRAQIQLAEKSGNTALAQEAQRRLDMVLTKKSSP